MNYYEIHWYIQFSIYCDLPMVKTFCTTVAKLPSIDRPSVHQHLVFVKGKFETFICNIRCPMRFVHFAWNPNTIRMATPANEQLFAELSMATVRSMQWYSAHSWRHPHWVRMTYQFVLGFSMRMHSIGNIRQTFGWNVMPRQHVTVVNSTTYIQWGFITKPPANHSVHRNNARLKSYVKKISIPNYSLSVTGNTNNLRGLACLPFK